MKGELDDILNNILINKTNVIINEGNEIHQISALSNQNINNNLSNINFGECEAMLRNKSNISSNEELIIYKIEHYIDNYNIPIIEYVLFSQDGKIKLNLADCDNYIIQYNIPVTIDENNIDKHDPTSSYYNDICSTITSEDGTDMTLYERKIQYNVNNMSLCENNCIYKGYNISTSHVGCDCQIKSELTFNNNSNNNNLLYKIETSKNLNNLDVTQCFNGSIEQIKSNSAFYILLFIFVIFIIIFIIFCTKGYNYLKNKIDNEIYYLFKKNKNVIQWNNTLNKFH